jgi:hypothetical protein
MWNEANPSPFDWWRILQPTSNAKSWISRLGCYRLKISLIS